MFVPRAVIAGARPVAGERVEEGVWWRIVKKLMSERATMSEMGGGVVCRRVEIEAVSLLCKRKAATEGKSHYPTSGGRQEAK